MEPTLMVKIVLMCVFFLEVTIFGNVVSKLSCFRKGSIMDLAMTFSGTLFLSIAMIDIIPEAIDSFNQYFLSTAMTSSSSSLHQNSYLPLTLIIAMTTFMVIMYIDKILIGQSHDHEYEVSFIAEPRKQEKSIHLGEEPNPPPNDELETGRSIKAASEESHSEDGAEMNWKPFVLQAGMSIHAFFECLAVGLQQSTLSVLSLASAILVHKWAEGLTLGLMYRKEGYSKKWVMIMIVVQGAVNVLGLVTGSCLISQGTFVMAFFMSISAGTFFYISLAEVLHEQVKHMTKSKMVVILGANLFIAFLVGFEKMQEESAKNPVIGVEDQI